MIYLFCKRVGVRMLKKDEGWGGTGLDVIRKLKSQTRHIKLGLISKLSIGLFPGYPPTSLRFLFHFVSHCRAVGVGAGVQH